MVIVETTIRVSEDVVQEAMLAEMSLEIEGQIRGYFIDSTGTVERMTPNQWDQ